MRILSSILIFGALLMPKWTGVVGGLEIAGGVVAAATGVGAAAAPYLINAGIGTALSGIGSLLQKSPLKGIAGMQANPVQPWQVIYGQTRVKPTRIFTNAWDSTDADNKWLDIVAVLACHPCQSVDQLLLDGNFVPIDPTTKCSYNRTSETFNVGDGSHLFGGHTTSTEFKRQAGVVTVTVNNSTGTPVANFLNVNNGDQVNVNHMPSAPDAQTLQGTYRITLSPTNNMQFTYLSPGNDTDILNAGHITTIFYNYKSKIYMEAMLGTQALGTTFTGMTAGTPYDGNTSNLVQNLVSSSNPSGNPWTADCSCVGHTVVFLRFHYNDQVFPNSLPDIAFVVSGKNDIYDPRTGTTGYTNNSALCTADYLSNAGLSENDTGWGFRLNYGTDIPSTPLINAANSCDEAVALAAGGTEPRYTCNGSFTLDERRGDILDELLTSCAGRLTTAGGQYVIYPGVWQGVAGSTMDLTQIATGPVRYLAKRKARDLYNAVKGTYVSPVNNWQASDYPSYMQDGNHGYATNPPGAGGNYDGNWYADGSERRYFDHSLRFTTSYSAAQRIAKIVLMRLRYQGTGTFRTNMTAYQMVAMDVWPFSFARRSWTNKQFEIQKDRLLLTPVKSGDVNAVAMEVEVDVQETDASIYDWSAAEELTPQGYQQPVLQANRNLAVPTSLTLESDASTEQVLSNGIVKSRILVTWADPVDGFFFNGGRIELQYQLVTTPAAPWSNVESVQPGIQQVYIDGVNDGEQYNVQIRAVNTANVPSDWVSAGPVTVASASSILFAPNGGNTYPVYQDALYPTATFNLTPQFEQASDGSVVAGAEVDPVVPPSSFSSVPAPQLSTTVTYGTSGSIPSGTSGYLALAMLDSGGLFSKLSDIIPFTVPAGKSSIELSITNYAAGMVTFLVYTGTTPQSLSFKVSNSTAASITLNSLASVSGDAYPIPDPNFDHFVAGVTKILLAGSFGGVATAPSTITHITTSAGNHYQLTLSGAAFTASALVGRVLSTIATAASGNPTPLQDYTITANDATSVTVVAPPPAIGWVGPSPSFAVGDQVVVRLQPDSATYTSSSGAQVKDSLLAMTADQYKGKVIRVFYSDGTNQTSFVGTNDATTFTVQGDNNFTGPVPVWFWIEESSFSANFQTTPAQVQTYLSSGTGFPVQFDNLPMFFAVQVYSADANGNQSDPSVSPIRDGWWPGAPGGSAAVTANVSGGSTIAVGVTLVNVDGTGAPYTITVPDPAALTGPLTLTRTENPSNTNPVTIVSASGAVLDPTTGDVSLSLDNQTFSSVTIAKQ